MWIGLLALIGAGFIGGQSSFFLKIALQEFPPLVITLLRFVIASLILLPFFLRQKKKIQKSDLKALVGSSIFFAGNVGIFGIAVQYTGAIVSQMLFMIVPIIVGILSHFMLSERFTKHKIIGSGLTFLGVLILVVHSATDADSLSFDTPLGNILILCAVFSWSLYIIFSKRLMNTYSPVTTSFTSYIVMVILLLPFLPIEQSIRPFHLTDVTWVGVLSIVIMGVVSSALLFFLIQVAVQKTSAFVGSLYQYLGPLSAALTAVPLLGEKPTVTLILSGILIIVGVFYTTSYQHLRKKLPSMLQ